MEILRPRTDTYPDAIGNMCDPASATRCTNDWWIHSSAASMQPTQTTSALPRCRSWRRSPRVHAACCWPGDDAHLDRPDPFSTHRVRESAHSLTPSRSRSRHAGGELRSNAAIRELALDGQRWRVDGESFDRVVLACPAHAHVGVAVALVTVGRRDVGGRTDRWRCPVDVGDAGRRVASPPARPVGLPRTERRGSGLSPLSRSDRRNGLTGPATTTSSFESRWAATGCRRCTSRTTNSWEMQPTNSTSI